MIYNLIRLGTHFWKGLSGSRTSNVKCYQTTQICTPIRQWENIYEKIYVPFVSPFLSLSLSLYISLCVCLSVSLFSPCHTKMKITTHTSKLQTPLSVNNPAFSGSCAHFFTEREREYERTNIRSTSMTQVNFTTPLLGVSLSHSFSHSVTHKVLVPTAFAYLHSPCSGYHILSLSLSLSLFYTSHSHTHTHTHSNNHNDNDVC